MSEANLCQHCNAFCEDAYGNPCLYCMSNGLAILLGPLKPVADPIQTAKKVMGVENCKCDLVNGDSKFCTIHKQGDSAFEMFA